MILLNFKTYKSASGKKALKLVKLAEKVEQKTGVKIFPAVQTFDLDASVKQTNLDIWIQHVDPIQPNRNTGFNSAYTAKLCGAYGCLINHSEKPISFKKIQKTINICRYYELKTLVFCSSPDMIRRVGQLKPNYVCLEDPSRVASGQAEFKSQKKRIKKALKLSKQAFILGAGISSQTDVQNALNLGAHGVALASAFVKSENPEGFLLSLTKPFID